MNCTAINRTKCAFLHMCCLFYSEREWQAKCEYVKSEYGWIFISLMLLDFLIIICLVYNTNVRKPQNIKNQMINGTHFTQQHSLHNIACIISAKVFTKQLLTITRHKVHLIYKSSILVKPEYNRTLLWWHMVNSPKRRKQICHFLMQEKKE